MKRLLLAPLNLILLTSCQSKRDICATWSASQINNKEASKKLGINLDDLNYYIAEENLRINNFCKFYTN